MNGLKHFYLGSLIRALVMTLSCYGALEIVGAIIITIIILILSSWLKELAVN